MHLPGRARLVREHCHPAVGVGATDEKLLLPMFLQTICGCHPAEAFVVMALLLFCGQERETRRGANDVWVANRRSVDAMVAIAAF